MVTVVVGCGGSVLARDTSECVLAVSVAIVILVCVLVRVVVLLSTSMP